MIINYISLSILIFLDLIKYVIIADVILSWLQIFGVMIRIGFIRGITTPIYGTVRKFLPTTMGPVDFSPIVVFMIIEILYVIVISLNEGVLDILPY